MARDFAKSFYRSKEWEAVRSYCLLRDHHSCVKCGAPAEEVHHIIHLTPTNIANPTISLNPANLMCLCKACHFAEHKGEHGKGRAMEEEYPYEFDENGFLVEKPIPPVMT